MTLRLWWLAVGATLAFSVLLSAGCGDDDDDVGADGDADTDADGDGDGVTFTGRVLAEEVEGVSAPLADVQVELLDDTGAPLDSAQTDADGEYSVTALEAEVAFVLAHATSGHAGQLRAQGIRDALRFYDLVLQSEAGLATVHEAVGLTYEADLGTVVVGFNPVDPDLGGEGATLDPPDHEAPFILVGEGAVSGNILAPICPNDGAVPCVDGSRGDFVFFPNVQPGPVTVDLIDPAGGTCHLRFPLDAWLVTEDASTIIEVDCLAD